MSLDLLKEKGVPWAKQEFTWRDMVRVPTSKLNDDALTRVRIILMNGIEAEAARFSHACARMNRHLQLPLARLRRIEQHQQALLNWLLPPDLSPLETTLSYAQTAIEVTASVAQQEPDPYLAQVYRFGMVEHVDHLYRYAALLDRVEGKDPNNILQSYTDICPGRPTSVAHRAPEDDLREAYNRKSAAPVTKINALTVLASAHQAHDYYMSTGPQLADPVARQLYAEIASSEEQHVTQYASIMDTNETWLEKWLLHEATEVYNYHSCWVAETSPRLKQIWQRFVDYELGQLHFVRGLLQKYENRDADEILPAVLPQPLVYGGRRDFMRRVLHDEVDLRAAGTRFIHKDYERSEAVATLHYRAHLNGEGSPSDTVAAGYCWAPGTELARRTTTTAANSLTPRDSASHGVTPPGSHDRPEGWLL